MTWQVFLLIAFIIVGVIAFIWFYFFYIKHLKLPNVYLVTGGVKTGKSFVSVALAVKTYKKNVRRCKIANFFRRILRKPIRELPMLYSNIQLRYVKFNVLTKDILEWKVKIPKKSVVLIDEVSLLADSMLFKDKEINEKLQIFVKLFGHFTYGGTMIVNTQSLHDCHYAFKRCISNYLYIASKRKFPFFSLLQVRELVHSEDNEIINNFDKDMELSARPLFLLNKYYKYYDCFCYSVFVDYLDLYVNYEVDKKDKHDSLKTGVLISFQDFKTLKNYEEFYMNNVVKKEVKENEKKKDIPMV